MKESHDSAIAPTKANSSQTAAPTLIAQTSAVGSWQVLPTSAPIIPIHAALLRTNKVLFVAGSGNDPNNVGETRGTAVWDINTQTFTRVITPTNTAGLPLDIFCGGHSFRSDGRLMFAGGTLQYDPFKGLRESLFFDPITEQWVSAPLMNLGRWYPTLLTLGDGKIFAISGYDINGSLALNPEIFARSTGWVAFSGRTSRFPLYAHLFLLRSGKIFYSGAYMGSSEGVTPRILTLPTTFSQPIVEQPVTGLEVAGSGDQAASVFLPPAQDQKVMIIGGGGSTTKRVNIIDLKAATPTYAPAAYLNYARMHHSAVLLPDRTVFVCNGSAMNEDIQKSMLPAEIYNPATNTWTVAAAQSVPRVYHSVALLLPDGRVLTAGGNPRRGSNELRLEVYSPPYMSQTRPVIQSAPQTANYNRTIVIQTNQASSIKWVSLVRPSANTHCYDTEQRLVDLPIVSRTATSLSVTTPSTGNLAPQGWYMLFISDNNNVPSVARWMQLL